jgi:hypothetical protein
MWGWLAAGPAAAQRPYFQPQTSPLPRPSYSPYLNLARGGNAGINYYGLVRPEQQFSSSIQQLRYQGGALQQSVGELEAASVPVTGHRSQFQNYNRYFQNLGNAPTPAAPRALGAPIRPPTGPGSR